MPKKPGQAAARRPDPRPERTRATLTVALMELIQEKRWEQIRVQDVLNRTNIGRSTFYAHFDNKYALLTAAIPDLAANILGPDTDGAVLDLLPLFEHIEEVAPMLRTMLSQPVLSEIFHTFHQQLKETWLTHLAAVGAQPADIDLVADVLAGSLVAVVKQSADSTEPVETGSICTSFTYYADAIIQAAIKAK